jgi:hypothetical protein
MMLPEKIRDDIRDRLWAIADELGWSALGDGERAKYYERWTKDDDRRPARPLHGSSKGAGLHQGLVA